MRWFGANRLCCVVERAYPEFVLLPNVSLNEDRYAQAGWWEYCCFVVEMQDDVN